jgi:hypothetical protein
MREEERMEGILRLLPSPSVGSGSAPNVKRHSAVIVAKRIFRFRASKGYRAVVCGKGLGRIGSGVETNTRQAVRHPIYHMLLDFRAYTTLTSNLGPR